MKKFTITSADWTTTIKAKSPTSAAVSALRRDKPKTLGNLIMISGDGIEPLYWSTATAMSRAGLKVER